MTSTQTTRLVSACALALMAGGVTAQRSHDATVSSPVVATSENRFVDMDWLRNNAALYTGATYHGATGKRVSAAGDANGDGLADMLVSSFDSDPYGEPGTVHLVFGADHSLPTSASLAGPDSAYTGTQTSRGGGMQTDTPMTQPGQAWVTLIGDGLGSRTGAGLAPAGDVNGDGLDDFLIGAPRAMGDAGADAGKVYLVFGRTEWPDVLALSDLESHEGLVLQGPHAGDRLGASVAGAGDVNGDGYGDVLLGAHWSSAYDDTIGTGVFGGSVGFGPTHGGAAFLVYGTPRFADGFGIDRMSADDGMLLTGAAAGDLTGAALAGTGDVNGDGFDDLLIGAPRADVSGMSDAGKAYLLLGADDLPGELDLGDLGPLGLTVKGGQAGEQLGAAVAGGSDLDGDHLPDFAIGAPGFDTGLITGSDDGRVIAIMGANRMVGVIELGDDVGSITVGGGPDFSGNGNRNLGSMVGTAMPFAPSVKHFVGANPGDRAGSQLAMGGNLQGDRTDDLVIGAAGSTGSFLLNGTKAIPDNMDLSVMTWRGMVFGSNSEADTAVAFVGDMDGDGFDDLAFGDADASPGNVPGAGQVHVVKGCANLALASGPIASGKTFEIVIHGTPHAGFILLVSAEARKVPISTWRGDYWLGGKHFETVLRSFDEDGEVVIPVAVPAVGFAGATLHWQSVTLPQGNGNDMSGLLSTTVDPID